MKNIVKPMILATAALVSFSGPSNAGVCDYRLSNLIGGAGTTAIAATAGGAVLSNVSASAMGIYTLTHAVTGATMLGSTLGGASAAGTVGIMGGTAGVLGTAGAIVTAPATLVVGVVVLAAVGASEGICYFKDERITDEKTIRAIMKDLGTRADPNYFWYQETTGDVFILNGQNEFDKYNVENLSIVNGTLMNSNWGIKTTIGKIGFIPLDKQPDS